LQAVDGSLVDSAKASKLINECSRMARGLANRHRIIEWFGKGSGMKRILHYTQLPGSWEEEFEKGTMLALLPGRIARIFGREAGQIELSSGLMAFFVPARGHQGQIYTKSLHENREVKFHLGFSYDGLQAWAVRNA